MHVWRRRQAASSRTQLRTSAAARKSSGDGSPEVVAAGVGVNRLTFNNVRNTCYAGLLRLRIFGAVRVLCTGSYYFTSAHDINLCRPRRELAGTVWAASTSSAVCARC